MDPATLAITSLVLTGASAGVGIIGAQQQASATADSLNYQAQVARNNAITANQNAAYAVEAGGVRAQAQDFKNRQLQGSIAAAQGASGIDVDSPTSQAVRDSAAQLGRLDTATLMQDAILQARASQTQSSNFTAQAGLDDMGASNAQTAGNLASVTSLLSGASSFSDKWIKYKNVGLV